MSIENVLTGFPKQSVSFLDDLRTTYGGDIVAPYEGGAIPAQAAAPGIETVILPVAEQGRQVVPATVGPLAVSGARQ